MANEEETLRAELKELRAQSSQLMAFVHEMYQTGGTDKPKPTDPMLGLVADLFELRCTDRDFLMQKCQEAVAGVTR